MRKNIPYIVIVVLVTLLVLFNVISIDIVAYFSAWIGCFVMGISWMGLCICCKWDRQVGKWFLTGVAMLGLGFWHCVQVGQY